MEFLPLIRIGYEAGKETESLRTKLRCFCLKATAGENSLGENIHFILVLLFYTKYAREITVTKVDTQLD